MSAIRILTNPDSSVAHSAVQLSANSDEIALQLASDRKFSGGFFRESFALEAVIAAVRSRARSLKLQLHYGASDEGLRESLMRFCQFPSNRIAFHLAHRVVDNRGVDVSDDIVRIVRTNSAAEANDFEAFVARTSTNGADLVATYDASARFPAMAYHSQVQGAVSQGRLNHFIQRSLDRSGGSARSANEIETTSELVKLLSPLVYETFQNTDQHALTDAKGNEIGRGARGVFLRVYSVPVVRAAEPNSDILPAGLPPVLKLALHDWIHGATTETLKFAEIVVFDSGPGFAARMSGKDETEMSTHAERDLVKECFAPRRTSSLQPGRGYGLDLVIRTLAEKSGIFRLRTGRVCLYGVFHKKVKAGGDLMSRVFPEQGRGAPMMLRGTVFTMVIPLAR